MSQPVKRLVVINWVVISLIVALGCIAIIYIARPRVEDVEEPAPRIANPPRARTPEEVPVEVDDPEPEPPVHELFKHPTEFDGTLVADLDALVKWRLKLGQVNEAIENPLGGIYLTADKRMLHAISGDGEIEWNQGFSDDLFEGLIADDEGNVFVRRGGTVMSFDPQGGERWSYEGEYGFCSGIAIDSNGNLVCKQHEYGNEDRLIAAVDREGREKWRLDAPYEFSGDPLVAGTKGRIFDMGRSGVFLTVTHAGTRGWGLGTGEGARGPGVDGRGLLYIATAPYPDEPWKWLLHCLQPQMGREVWNRELPAAAKYGPVVTPGGRIYIVCAGPSNRRDSYQDAVLAYGDSEEPLWAVVLPQVQGLLVPDDPGQPLVVLGWDMSYFVDGHGGIFKTLSEEAGHPVPVLLGEDGTVYCRGDGELVALDLGRLR